MTTKEMIEVMQAYAEGKKIQWRTTGCQWDDWTMRDEPTWNWSKIDYRIKPESTEPKYRPYKDTEEMIEDFKERFDVEVPSYAMPEIWVKIKGTIGRGFVSEFGSQVVRLFGAACDMKELFDGYTYLDGSPCGMKEE